MDPRLIRTAYISHQGRLWEVVGRTRRWSSLNTPIDSILLEDCRTGYHAEFLPEQVVRDFELVQAPRGRYDGLPTLAPPVWGVLGASE